jgi:hypothetical protein
MLCFKNKIDIKFDDGKSAGSIKWGTFFALFFVLFTIVSGINAVYKRYNVVKLGQKKQKTYGNENVIYQKII